MNINKIFNIGLKIINFNFLKPDRRAEGEVGIEAKLIGDQGRKPLGGAKRIIANNLYIGKKKFLNKGIFIFI